MISVKANTILGINGIAAICPAGAREVRNYNKDNVSPNQCVYSEVAEDEVECKCLQRRPVEEDLLNGVNPLGRGTQQCFQVPTDMIYLYKKKGNNQYRESPLFF